MTDIVAELDAWLTAEAQQEHVPPDGAGLIAVVKVQRARDEIVVLRGDATGIEWVKTETLDKLQMEISTLEAELVEARTPVIDANVYLREKLETVRAEALEEAARICTDHILTARSPRLDPEAIRAGLAAAIRALKEKTSE
jgi:hypothetical protein